MWQMSVRPGGVVAAVLISASSLAVVAPGPVEAAEPSVITKLVQSEPRPGDRFGSSVGIDAATIVVGAPADASGGRVHVFDLADDGGWSETELIVTDLAAGDRFGHSVAIHDDRVAVGAPGRSRSRGSVAMYERDGRGGWSEQRVIASDLTVGDQLGVSVAAGPGLVAVGAIGADDNGDQSGAVHLFALDDAGRWHETRVLASDGQPGDLFGSSVAIDDGRLLVGAKSAMVNGSRTGAVYVYEPDGADGWAETKLTASDGERGSSFGEAIAADRERIVVAAPFDDAGQLDGDDAGAVYVYELDDADGWVETKLTAPDGRPEQLFGNAVAIDGTTITVGNRDDDDLGGDSGAIYTFEPDGAGGWTAEKSFAPDGTINDYFGFAVAADAHRIAVGTGNADPGGVYVFTVEPLCLGRTATISGPGRLVGTDGDDVIVGSNRADRIDGRGGDDIICGGAGDDVLIGGSGDDILAGGEGADEFRGGPGSDTVDYSDSNGGVRIALNLMADDGRFEEGDHIDLGVENAVGSRFSDTILGNALANELYGGPGTDLIRGRGGNDVLDGGIGNDFLIGGPGSDVLRGGDGVDRCRGSAQLDLYFTCDRVQP